MEVELGLEAPILDGGEQPEVDVEQPELDGGESHGDEPETPPEGETPEGEQPRGEFRAVDNGKLSAQAKAVIDNLKATDPKLAKAIQRALFAEDRFRRELPNGFKDVQTLRERIETLGGDEGIQSMQSELDGWRDFDQKWTAGDPSILKFLTETPEAKDAFQRIAPSVFEKFLEVNPDGYSSYVAQTFLSDMQSQQIPLLLMRLGDFVKDNPAALETLQGITKYVDRLNAFAQKPVAPAEKAPQVDQRASELDAREQTLMRQEWKGAADSQHQRIFAEQWTRLGKGVPADKQKLVLKLYEHELAAKIAGKKDFDANMGRYFSAKQKDGFLRLHESTFKELVPLAIRSAIAEAGVSPARRPNGTAQPGKGTPAVPAGKAPDGFIRVAQKPSTSELDLRRMDMGMYSRKQAILKDGRKVTWA